jgi:hypothetical protein
MRLQFVKTLWGVTEQMGNAPGGYARLFKRIAAEGFQGVETPIRMVEDVKEFGAALREAGLAYVAMINTCTFAPDDTSSRSLDAHVESFRAQVAEAAALQPVLINAHSGCDSWSREVAEAYFSAVLAIEAAQAIPIVHETHRGRVLYNPWATRDLCRAFPALKLTADLSHFCVVGERVFSAADEDWQTCLAVIARATRHIHARVSAVASTHSGRACPCLTPPLPSSPPCRLAMRRARRCPTPLRLSTRTPSLRTRVGGMPSSLHRRLREWRS